MVTIAQMEMVPLEFDQGRRQVLREATFGAVVGRDRAIVTPLPSARIAIDTTEIVPFELRRGCLEKQTIAEIMAPSMLVGCSWTNTF